MKRIAVSIVAVAAGITALGAIRAVTPVPQMNDGWWMKRHAEKRIAATNQPHQVVFIGDSITHGWEGAGKKVWNKYFAGAPFNALNLGYGADRTEHVLWRLTTGGELDGFEAKAIVLMIGTNNSGHFMLKDETPADTIVAIKKILDVIAVKQPKARIILTAIFPRENNDRGERCDERNLIVNRELASFADGRRVIWCDFSDKFLSRDGRLSRELFPDLLHPNETGYEMWASAVLPVLRRCMEAKDGEPIESVWPSCPRGYATGDRVSACIPLSRVNHYSPSRGEWWWVKRLERKRNEIVASKDGVFDLVLIGDSITHFWEESGSKQGVDTLAEMKAAYRTLNLGYGGDRTGTVLWRIRNGELDGYQAKCMALMIGTNNRDRPQDVAAGIREILRELKERQPQAKIILMPIFPRGKDASDKQRQENEKVNAIIRGYADEKVVFWLDFNSQLVDENGDSIHSMLKDRLHPSTKGYRIWWENLHPLVKKIVGK